MLNMSQVDADKNPATLGTCCAASSRDSVARHNRTERTPMVLGESTCCMSGIRLQVFAERIQALMLTIRTSSDRSEPHELNPNTSGKARRLKTLFWRLTWPHAVEFPVRY